MSYELTKKDLIRISYVNAIMALDIECDKNKLIELAVSSDEFGLMHLTNKDLFDISYMDYIDNDGVAKFKFYFEDCKFIINDRAQYKEWKNLTTFIRERDNNRCVYCGSTEEIHVDHVHPVSKGGLNDASNLVCACSKCNIIKGARTLADLISNGGSSYFKRLFFIDGGAV